MTVQQWQSRIIERAAEALAYWVETTPEDKVDWTPPVEGSAGIRTILQQAEEIVGLNTALTRLLSGSAPEKSERKLSSRAEAAQALRESATALAAVVRDMPDSAFTQEYDTGWAKLSGAVLIELAANNMHYHGGQVNYVQMLAGDKEFHFPDSFFTF
jgi:hypothetical protein